MPLSVGFRWIVTASSLLGRPLLLDLAVGPEGDADRAASSRRSGGTARSDWESLIRPSSTPSQAPASGADAAVSVSTNDAVTATAMNAAPPRR